MILTTAKPNTLGSLKENDKFKFDNDPDTYYFIGNYGISGFVMWNDSKKQKRSIRNFTHSEYVKIKISLV